jgi:hypothetical protein
MKEVPWARGFYGLDGNRLNSMWSDGNALNPKKIGEPEGREALMYKIYIQCIFTFHFGDRSDYLSLPEGGRAEFEGRMAVMPCFFNRF